MLQILPMETLKRYCENLAQNNSTRDFVFAAYPSLIQQQPAKAFTILVEIVSIYRYHINEVTF